MGLSLMVLIYFMARSRHYPRDRRAGLKEKLAATGQAILPLAMPIIMLGGIASGIFTPTEAAAVAAAYALVISMFVYHTVKVRDLPKIFADTMVTTAVVTFIISTTSVFSFQLSVAEAGERAAMAMLGLTHNKWVVLLMLNVLLLLLGAIMEAGVVLILFIPIIYPIVTSPQVGVDPIHLGVIMAVNLMIGVATPPVGMCLFVMSHISKLKLEVLMRAILPFLVPIVLCLLLITYVPQIVTILPDTFMPQTKASAVIQATNQTEMPAILQKPEQVIHRRADARVIKVGVTHSQNHSFTLALQRFGRRLETESQGRYRVRVYFGGQLGSEKVLQEMLTIGTAEMTVTGRLNTYEPLFAVFELPYLYRDRDHVFKVSAGDVMEEVAASLPPRGLRLIGFYENGFRHITNSVRPIRTPEDVRGLKIRTPENQAQIATFQALGAEPVSLSFSELYSALLLGAVEGQENPLQNIFSGKLYEAQKHIAMTGHIYNSAYVLISERFWQTLPEGDQRLVGRCLAESSRWQLNYMKHRDVELEEQLKAVGMEFTYPDRAAFEAACAPAYEMIFDKLGPRARDIVERIRQTR